MKFLSWPIFLCLAISFHSSSGQTAMKDLKVGHQFFISIPDYMTKTTGLNSDASLQFKSVVKDVAGFVIEDSKEDLKLAEVNFSSMKEYADYFLKDFLKDEDQRKISTPNSFKKDLTNYVEFDASFHDKESKAEICYYVCLIETQNYFYKVLCWSSMENKIPFKPDFQKIAQSLKD